MMYITQALCSQRHCACAVLWDSTEMTQAEAERKLKETMALQNFRPHCGICGGGLSLESARTKYATIDEAKAAAAPLLEANIASRRLLDSLGLTKERLN